MVLRRIAHRCGLSVAAGEIAVYLCDLLQICVRLCLTLHQIVRLSLDNPKTGVTGKQASTSAKSRFCCVSPSLRDRLPLSILSNMPAIEVIPSARRLVKSLRDLGYDFVQAVADIVDNSLAANSSEIQIDIEFDGDDSWVRIADNGVGMRPDVLREAMRYGAARDYDEEDLGKFGLGLKTASMSQCQRLSVASRWHPSRADIQAYAWDLEHIEITNRWEILPVAREDRTPALFQLLRDHPGTVVLWERLDRILGYRHPFGENARSRLAQMSRDVEQHLAMVLHRFLAGEARKKVRILVNGNEVRPWDPFCRGETRTERWPALHLKIDEDGQRGIVRIDPYILPHQSEFSSPSAFKNAAGPSGWNQQQGLYVYRANRMIQSGGWSRLRAPDEHTKLARIALSFLPDLDEAFKVNVAKMRVQVPSSIREELLELAQQLTKAARRAYDRKEKKSSDSAPQSAASAAKRGDRLGARATDGDATTVDAASSKEFSRQTTRYTLDQWGELALDVAKPRERPYIETIIERLGSAQTRPLRK
jgi:hypothetical protein